MSTLGGEGGLSSADIFLTRRVVVQMRTFALFDIKKCKFFENYGVSARKGEGRLSKYGQFTNKGKWGSIFRYFMRTSFMDGPFIADR